MVRIGFAIDGLVPSLGQMIAGRSSLLSIIRGCHSYSSIGIMRYGWIADAVNSTETYGIHYELYRPFRKYDAVVFLKSMNRECVALCKKLNAKGIKTIFDLNVDYVTPAQGVEFYKDMMPTSKLRAQAMEMISLCSAVICDSSHIHNSVKNLSRMSQTLTDNIRDDLIKPNGVYAQNEKVRVVWCGQACKAFELLAIKDVLLKYSNKIDLVLVTGPRSQMDRIYEPYRSELYSMLNRLGAIIIPYENVEHLMRVYDQGGVFISPRFLDNTYNMGHTEWKITLPMARGLFVVCSEQPSYSEVAEKTGGNGIRICHGPGDWDAALGELISKPSNVSFDKEFTTGVIRSAYSTSVVARKHSEFIKKVLNA